MSEEERAPSKGAFAEPALRDFSQSLPMALLRAREAVMRHFRPMLRHFGLSEQQWRVLRALVDVPDIEITRLAEATFLLGPSLSRILKDLESRRLIARRVSESDQRFGLVSLTPDGRSLVLRIGVQSERIYAEIERRAGRESLAGLMALLGDANRTLSAGAPAEFDRRTTGGETGGRLRGRPRKHS